MSGAAVAAPRALQNTRRETHHPPDPVHEYFTMAAPAPMTMEPSIDDSDLSGNFKLNGAGSNKVLYYAPFHKNFGKTCGVIPNATWVRLLPRSRTQRAMVSSLLESRGIVRSIHSAAIRARRRVRARFQAIPILHTERFGREGARQSASREIVEPLPRAQVSTSPPARSKSGMPSR